MHEIYTWTDTYWYRTVITGIARLRFYKTVYLICLYKTNIWRRRISWVECFYKGELFRRVTLCSRGFRAAVGRERLNILKLFIFSLTNLIINQYKTVFTCLISESGSKAREPETTEGDNLLWKTAKQFP